jgi:hypothetical protein
MASTFVKRIIIAGLLAVLVAGCSKESNTTGSSGVSGQKVYAQQHSGSLPVRIIPESPTSGDELRAVLTEGGKTETWRWEKNGQILEDENTPQLAKNHFAKGDTISVTVTMGNLEGKASVVIADSPPEIRSVRLTPDNICKGVDITAVPDGFDADGDELRYSYKWEVNGEEKGEDSAVLQGNSFKAGDRVSLCVTAYDGDTAGKPFQTQSVTIPKGCPVFVSTPPTSFKGTQYTYNADARDPDGGAITYLLAAAPAGMSINEKTGLINWPITRESSGTHEIEIIAQNSEGGKVSQRYSLNITLPPGASQ